MRGRILNRTECAGFFGVAPTTIDAWVRRGCPVVKRATGRGSGGNTWQFDSAVVSEWRETQAVQNAVGNIAKIDEQEARRRKIAAEAALAEYELAEKRREVVAIEDVATMVAREYGLCRARLLAGTPKTAGDVARAHGVVDVEGVRGILDGAIQEALSELVSVGDDPDGPGGNGGSAAEAPGGADGNDEAPAPLVPQRVGGPKPGTQPRGRSRAREMADQPG